MHGVLCSRDLHWGSNSLVLLLVLHPPWARKLHMLLENSRQHQTPARCLCLGQ